MGTDIYERFEVRRNGVWEPVELLPEFDSDTATDEEFISYWNHPAYIGRNYALFAVLADVRNTFGLQPVSIPRGLPEDVSPQVKDYIEDLDDVSWVLLDELPNYDWDQITVDSRHPHMRPESCREAVEPFFSRSLPYLLAQADIPADLRLVFGFSL